jgi:hypothetical protein
MFEQSDFGWFDEQYDHKKLLKRREWREKRKEPHRPREKELCRLTKYENEFKGWVACVCALPESWDWDDPMYPLSWFWNHFKDEFLARATLDTVQNVAARFVCLTMMTLT